MNSQFEFLQPEWPDVYAAAAKAEELIHPDARASCFYARRALELAVNWLYKHEASLQLPYQDHLSPLIYQPTFRGEFQPATVQNVRGIRKGEHGKRGAQTQAERSDPLRLSCETRRNPTASAMTKSTPSLPSPPGT